MSRRNKLVVPGAQNAIDQMKYEIAREFGVNLGPDTSFHAKTVLLVAKSLNVSLQWLNNN